jgi:hypothetical protein
MGMVTAITLFWSNKPNPAALVKPLAPTTTARQCTGRMLYYYLHGTGTGIHFPKPQQHSGALGAGFCCIIGVYHSARGKWYSAW